MRSYLFGLMILITALLGACNLPAASSESPTLPPPPTPTTELSPIIATESIGKTPPEATPSVSRYSNSEFRISFDYPSSWFGPEEYVADRTLRVEVGSDVIYPYGTGLDERPSSIPNSYVVVIQYTENDQNPYWSEIYRSLDRLQAGETITDARSRIIKVRTLRVGRFEGVEYITTLSETAQTEPVFTRQVILFDDQSNWLTIMGTPSSVIIPPGGGWREIFQNIDAANLLYFNQLIESLVLQ